MASSGFLTAAEAARRIGIRCSAVYALVSENLLPVYRCGPTRNRLCFAEEDIADFLEECRLGAAGRFRTPILERFAGAGARR